MKTKTNLRHLNRLESTNNVDRKVFTSRKISGVFSSYPVRNFCGFPAGDTPEPAVSQVPILHNRSLRSLLFRLGLDSRQNLMWKRLLPVLKEKMYWIHFSFQNLLNQPEIRDILTSEVSL